MTQFNFQEQLALGQGQEIRVEYWLKTLCDLRQANLEEQKYGVDFFVTPKIRERGDSEFSLEVKADFRSVTTGNFYIETQLPDKLGWAHTCQADILLIVRGDCGLFTTPTYIRSQLEKWGTECKLADTNERANYTSQGLLVPHYRVKGQRCDLSKPITHADLIRIMSLIMRSNMSLAA